MTLGGMIGALAILAAWIVGRWILPQPKDRTRLVVLDGEHLHIRHRARRLKRADLVGFAVGADTRTLHTVVARTRTGRELVLDGLPLEDARRGATPRCARRARRTRPRARGRDRREPSGSARARAPRARASVDARAQWRRAP